MEVITVESDAFKQIMNKLDAIQKLNLTSNVDATSRWLDNKELTELLKISKRTAQSYRDNGLIAFSQVGNKIYYRLSDVEDLLIKHLVKSRK